MVMRMSREPDLSLRIVVQFIAGSTGSPSHYRLIAYGSAWTFPTLTFPAKAELMEKLEAAGILTNLLPQLDEPMTNATRIVCSATCVLNDAQLRILGLAF